MDDKDRSMRIRVDPRVELFSTIHRLAGTNQYDFQELPGYIEEVEEHFKDYADHKAVRLARELRNTYGLDGNSPMALAVYLTGLPELKGRAPLCPPPVDLDRRWTAEAISSFLEAVREFAHDTDFQAFFDAQRGLYERATANLYSSLEGAEILPWFQDFFGYKPDDFVIILGLQNGSCNYGASVTLENGHREFSSLLGASHPDSQGAPRYARHWVLPIIVHEFCHSYVNPLVDRHKKTLRSSGERIFPLLEAQLRRWGYNHWWVMMNEYITRACVIRYLVSSEGKDAEQERVKVDERAGFPGIQDLASLLEEYESHRDSYPDLDSFMPRIAEFFSRFPGIFQY